MLRSTHVVLACTLLGCACSMPAQTAPAATQSSAASNRRAGTVKSASADALTISTAAGQDVTIAVPSSAKVLVVAPGAKDLSGATPGSLADVAAGDRVSITGTAGEAADSFTASRVILMKSAAIAETHAAEAAAWARGGGGIVKSVSGTTIVMSSGMKTVTINTTPSTIVRRYSGSSVKFEDAVKSDLASISAGDQLRVRGNRSADGSSIEADEIVAGTFRNYSGLLTAVDAKAGTVTLKDLASKKAVTVAVTANSDVHRMPPQMAQRVAAELKGGAAGAPGAGQHGAGGPPAGGPPAGAHAGPPPAGAPPAQGPGGEAGRASRAGSDLSSMIAHMPAETLAGLKAGDAVMIVATSASASAATSTAVTLVAGVDPILTASPKGEMTISPWSLGGGGGEGGDSGGGGGR